MSVCLRTIPRLLALTTLSLTMHALAAAEPGGDEGPDIHFWIIENTKLDGGKHRTSALFLYHRTTNPDGSLYSSHYLTYVSAPEFTAVLPLWYQIGEARHQHAMLVPLWFQGPGYGVAPLALSGGWRRHDGGTSLWITPLFHAERNVAGRLEDLHLLTWFQGDAYQWLLPFFYRSGEPGLKHTGVIPLWFSGPDYWTAPLALSAGWQCHDGGDSTWITPLFHLDHDHLGKADGMHVLNWYHNQDSDVVFPLYWSSGADDARHHALVPLWVDGPNYWALPLLLSGSGKNAIGGRTTWVTPLFHSSTNHAGNIDSLHALNWLHEPDRDIVFPLVWLDHDANHTTGTVFPLWFGSDTWWIAPPLLSGGATSIDGDRSLWLTPLYHQHTSADRQRQDYHALVWFAGADQGPQASSYQCLFPLWYHDASSVAGQPISHTAVIPLWIGGPNFTIIPPLLSGSWHADDGSASTWITPLFHRTANADGTLRNLHAGLWYEEHQAGTSFDPKTDTSTEISHDLRVLFPLYWQSDRTTDGSSRRYTTLVPLWFSGPDHVVVPPLLSWWQRDASGATSTWITPLFHQARNADGQLTSMHALTWIESGDTRMLLPFYCTSGDQAHRTTAIVPLWLSNHEGWTAPLLLSWQRHLSDGSDTTWITPLAHVSHDPDGSVSSLHVLNWIQSKDTQLLFPLAYRGGPQGQRHQGIVPLVFTGPDYWAVPLALSAGGTHNDGSSTTWITPLFHQSTSADGQLSSRHVLNWFQGTDSAGKSWQMLFPLAYSSGQAEQRQLGLFPFFFSGPDYWTVPLALSGGGQRNDGGSTTWITPLFHVSHAADGHRDGMHALTWLASDSGHALLPFYYDYGADDDRQQGIIPLWFSTPTSTTLPLLLSGRWRLEAGGHSTWITPLFHRGSDAAGNTTDWHALNVIHAGDTTVIAPLAWFSGTAENRERIVLPIYFQGSDHLVIAPLYYRTTSPEGNHSGLLPLWFSGPDWWTTPLALSAGWSSGDRHTTMLTPLYHRTTEHGETQNLHLLTYISSPEIQAVAPLYWQWRTDAGGQRTVLAPLWYQHSEASGDFTATAMPLLFSYHRGAELDTSFGYQLFPFIVQNTTSGHEYNALWRLVHVREQHGSTEMSLWPLWWSEHREQVPASWQILGGLVGRECDREQHTSLSYAAWGALRFGSRTTYATP